MGSYNRLPVGNSKIFQVPKIRKWVGGGGFGNSDFGIGVPGSGNFSKMF